VRGSHSYELEPGDMLVHHHLTVHGSAGNATLRRDGQPLCALAGMISASSSGLTRWRQPTTSSRTAIRSIARSSRCCGRGRHGCLPPLRLILV